MELMKNKYLIFDDIILKDDNTVKNTTTLNLLPSIPDKYFSNDYILEYKVADDRLLESIAFELYENTNYWDILLILNGMRSMNELPVNHDIVISRADRKLLEWKKKGALLPGNLTDEVIQNKYENILLLEEELNEKFRYIKYISTDDLSELEADLTSIKSHVKINENLIINKEE